MDIETGTHIVRLTKRDDGKIDVQLAMSDGFGRAVGEFEKPRQSHWNKDRSDWFEAALIQLVGDEID